MQMGNLIYSNTNLNGIATIVNNKGKIIRQIKGKMCILSLCKCVCSFLYPCRSLFYHTLLSRHWSQWSKKFYDDIPRNIYEKCNCNPFIVSICRKSNVYNLGIILSKCTESFGLPQQYMQLEMACNYSCSAF